MEEQPGSQAVMETAGATATYIKPSCMRKQQAINSIAQYRTAAGLLLGAVVVVVVAAAVVVVAVAAVAEPCM